MTEKIQQITLGLRYDRAFKVTDIIGEIVDDVAHGRKSPFETGRFTKIRHNVNSGKALFNPETRELFSVDIDNLIVILTVKDFTKDFKFLKERVVKFVHENIFEKHGIKNIQRKGVILEYRFEDMRFLNQQVSQITKGEVSEQNQYALRFSRKLPAVDARASQEKGDYKNMICTIEREDDSDGGPSSVLVNIDYQHYFDPPQDNIRDADLSKFLDEALSYNKKFQDGWLKGFIEKEG